MISAGTLTDIIKRLREKEGLTALKLREHPLLLEVLGTSDIEEGEKRLRDTAHALADTMTGLAIRNALAVGFSVERNLSERRRLAIQGIKSREGLDRPSRSTLNRREEAGAQDLAELLLERYRNKNPALLPADQVGRKASTPPTSTTPDRPVDTAGRTRSPRRGVLIVALVGLIGLGALIVHRVTDGPSDTADDPTTPPDALQVEARYDGKDPRGLDGTDSKCADPPASEPVESSRPAVFGPEGKRIGIIELRTSPACPVIWARVLWGGLNEGTYVIPAGWTLHVIGHRPETGTRFDFTEPSRATPIPYGLGPMLTTLRGCVFVEAYFTSGDQKTVPATTSCAQR
ncbi:hypothetical protein [Actinosynnema sp. NPDC023587]|uniref:hypothetical protein n=1 Tax=Actinosynnema sp. NPDC023587 TaxID=3154695 RepID=UPI0033E25A6C